MLERTGAEFQIFQNLRWIAEDPWYLAVQSLHWASFASIYKYDAIFIFLKFLLRNFSFMFLLSSNSFYTIY